MSFIFTYMFDVYFSIHQFDFMIFLFYWMLLVAIFKHFLALFVIIIHLFLCLLLMAFHNPVWSSIFPAYFSSASLFIFQRFGLFSSCFSVFKFICFNLASTVLFALLISCYIFSSSVNSLSVFRASFYFLWIMSI